MAEFVGIKCDQCPAHETDPKDWFVAIESGGVDGVIYEPLSSLSDDLPAEYSVRHLCCEQCARIDFNLWLDRHKQTDLQRKAQTA